MVSLEERPNIQRIMHGSGGVALLALARLQRQELQDAQGVVRKAALPGRFFVKIRQKP
jgi:hypothetical protein